MTPTPQLPTNAEEAFERIDREELHKILFIHEIDNDGLYTPVVNDFYKFIQKERREAVTDFAKFLILYTTEMKMGDIDVDAIEEEEILHKLKDYLDANQEER